MGKQERENLRKARNKAGGTKVFPAFAAFQGEKCCSWPNDMM